jgi:hypothetical protein
MTPKLKYYWQSAQFNTGPNKNEPSTIVSLLSEDFDTEEDARQDAEKNVKRRTKNWGYSWGGTSVYKIVTKVITQN